MRWSIEGAQVEKRRFALAAAAAAADATVAKSVEREGKGGSCSGGRGWDFKL